MYRTLTCLTLEHSLELVLLAAMVCCLTAFTGVSLLGRARASTESWRLTWLAAAAVTTGAGIWTTHFVAMLAYRPGLPVAYELGLTLASMLVAMAVTALGLALVTYGSAVWHPPAGGAVVGLGIAGMHFTGMAAMRAQAETGWDAPLVAAALLLAVGLGAASMTAFARRWTRRSTLLAAGLLTAAIVALHFTAMGALELTPTPLRPLPEPLLSQGWLASGIAAATIWILTIGLVGALVDRHLARRAADEAVRLQGLVNATFEGIVIHAEGRVLDANDALGRLLGYPGDSLIGRRCSTSSPRIMWRWQGHGSPPARRSLTRRSCCAATAAGCQVELLGAGRDLSGAHGRVAAVRDMTERRRADERIRHLAHHDGLTGLPNRALFHDRLEQALASARRTGQTMAVLCLDLDRFKEVNDLYGHAAGDELLVQVGMRLCAETRQSDTVARLGGDEFAVIQCGMSRPDDGGLAQRLIDTIGNAFTAWVSRPDRCQRRHRAVPQRWRRCRRAAAQRRPRPLPRQGRRPQHVS